MPMTQKQVGMVLAYCAAFDARTVGKMDIVGWHDVIGHYRYDRAIEAVKRYYTYHRERMMPSDVVEWMAANPIRESQPEIEANYIPMPDYLRETFKDMNIPTGEGDNDGN